MFGGKTSGLLADVRKMRIAGYNVALFKPAKDNRYSEDKIVNHDGESIDAINVICYKDIMDHINENPHIDVIAIDEFQFIKSYKNPNKDPYCPPPTGRFECSLNPCKMINQCVGPKFRKKCYCYIII